MTKGQLPVNPLPPSRYRALRARYNALLVTLYERTSLTLREIAAVAGRTDRAVQIRVRALGCRPRNAKTCRPGTNVGVRRAGPKPPPLNAPATRRVVVAFAEVARALAASAEAQAATELQRATARAQRRTVRTQTRMITSAARQLRHLAATIEHAAAARDALPASPKRSRFGFAAASAGHPTRKPTEASKPSRAELRLAQERVLREQQARMREAHQAADQAKAVPTATPPGFDADAERRINEIAARYYAPRPLPRPLPRIRRP